MVVHPGYIILTRKNDLVLIRVDILESVQPATFNADYLPDGYILLQLYGPLPPDASTTVIINLEKCRAAWISYPTAEIFIDRDNMCLAGNGAPLSVLNVSAAHVNILHIAKYSSSFFFTFSEQCYRWRHDSLPNLWCVHAWSFGFSSYMYKNFSTSGLDSNCYFARIGLNLTTNICPPAKCEAYSKSIKILYAYTWSETH